MKFGKIRIEDGQLIFTRHMVVNSLPVADILWAYVEKGSSNPEDEKLFLSSEVAVITRRNKEYHFAMPEKEAENCVLFLKALNPEMASGFPDGTRIRLESLPNTRDLGGLMTMDDRHILPGRLLRSGDLYHISQCDQQVLLDEYHVSRVIDLRTETEVKKRPDTILPGVEYYRIPIYDEEIDRSRPLFGDIDEALDKSTFWTEDQIISMYGSIPGDIYSVKQIARFLDILLKTEKGAVLWHGSTGKDRTGIVTAILLAVLGVPRLTIMKDFLRSNLYLEEDMKHMFRLLESSDEDTREAEQNLEFYFRVQENCLNRMFREIDSRYGSIYQFFRKELYLSPKSITILKDRYLI